MAHLCPECSSSDVEAPDDPALDAIGVLECQLCGFSDLADAFEASDDDCPF